MASAEGGPVSVCVLGESKGRLAAKGEQRPDTSVWGAQTVAHANFKARPFCCRSALRSISRPACWLTCFLACWRPVGLSGGIWLQWSEHKGAQSAANEPAGQVCSGGQRWTRA